MVVITRRPSVTAYCGGCKAGFQLDNKKSVRIYETFEAKTREILAGFNGLLKPVWSGRTTRNVWAPLIHVVHTNAPRGACQITVKCSMKTILSDVLVKVLIIMALKLLCDNFAWLLYDYLWNGGGSYAWRKTWKWPPPELALIHSVNLIVYLQGTLQLYTSISILPRW